MPINFDFVFCLFVVDANVKQPDKPLLVPLSLVLCGSAACGLDRVVFDANTEVDPISRKKKSRRGRFGL